MGIRAGSQFMVKKTKPDSGQDTRVLSKAEVKNINFG